MFSIQHCDNRLFEAWGVCDPAIVSDGHTYYGSIFDTYSAENIFFETRRGKGKRKKKSHHTGRQALR